MIRCGQYIILFYFIYKIAFDDRLKHDNYYDNYMHKKAKVRQVLEFNSYNITVKLGIIYKHTIKYSNLIFFNKYNRLLTANSTNNLKIMVKQTFVCKTVLNNFEYQIWLNNSPANLKFPMF